MKKHETLDHWKTGRLLAAALFIAGALLGGVSVQAATNCPDDLDCDGLLDAEETAGIQLPDTVIFRGATGAFIPRCDGIMDRAYCLDPATPDVFVILARANSSKIPEDPWKFVKLATASGGLGINVHELEPADPMVPTMGITSTQNAAWISESLAVASGTDVKLGSAPHTTPNVEAIGTVFTKRVEDVVLAKCTANVSESNCKDNGGTVGKEAVINLYIQHTLAHEVGHMLFLNTVFNSRFDGWHYKSGSGYVLDQTVSSSSSGGKVTFNITKIYTPADQAGATLK